MIERQLVDPLIYKFSTIEKCHKSLPYRHLNDIIKNVKRQYMYTYHKTFFNVCFELFSRCYVRDMLVQFNEPILLGICHKDDKEYLDATKSFRIQLAKFLPILVFTKMLVHLISPNVWFVHGVICIFVKWGMPNCYHQVFDSLLPIFC